MPFPAVQRVIYKKNSLRKVTCQLRFPPILRIDAEPPADFQDQIRKDFPELAEKSEVTFEFPSPIARQIPRDVLSEVVQRSGVHNYEFGSVDGDQKINLTRNFVALTSNTYVRWESFKNQLNMPFQALVSTYSPESLSRIGLRYHNIIQRSEVGLPGVQWDQLLKPYVAGILASKEVGESVEALECKHEIRLADGQSLVRMIIGFAEAKDTGEVCFTIDNDFYNTGRTEVDATMDKLDFLNSRASRLIQWCITDRLHEAMEPQPL